jgi:ATP phosphoribosyltransferase
MGSIYGRRISNDEYQTFMRNTQVLFFLGFGEDWVRENNSHVARVAELGYAKRTLKPVRWVIAVKDNSKIRRIKDLQGKRIATELVNVTKAFLKKNRIKAVVEFSWGATEVKAKSGLADAER